MGNRGLERTRFPLAIHPPPFTRDNTMSQTSQPDLIPPPAHVVLEVPGSALEHTIQRLRDLGVVILAFDVRASTYTLNLIVPHGMDITRVTEGER